MELLVKVGDKRHQADANYAQGWRDGQVIDIRPDGFHKNPNMLKRMCLIQVPGDYWNLRGSADWKSSKQSVMDFKKFLVPTDSNGKYPWEFGYLKDEKRARCRDWFIDYQALLDGKLITKSDYDSFYDFNRNGNILTIDRDFTSLIKHEDSNSRIKPFIKNMAVAAGTFSIGAAGDYATVTAAEADIADPLTGNLTFEHLDEETATTGNVVFDTDTATFLLKLTAAAGAEHDGTGYGNGARINLGTFDSLVFNETVNGDLDDVEVSKLAIDASGAGNRGINFSDGSNSGRFTANRMLIEGDADTIVGIIKSTSVNNMKLTNNIVFGIGNGAGDGGISFQGAASGTDIEISNNTCIKNFDNIISEGGVAAVGTLVVKNNLCQSDSGGADYRDDGTGFGTAAKNVSEDATSPDASYQSKDLHTNSIFNGFATDDYTLDSAGDATNLAIADDGDDLSGSFTDDIIGQTRSTWYIGASEIVVVSGVKLRTLTLMGAGR